MLSTYKLIIRLYLRSLGFYNTAEVGGEGYREEDKTLSVKKNGPSTQLNSKTLAHGLRIV